jgi:DNA-binding MarR family transcriptional regulator
MEEFDFDTSIGFVINKAASLMKRSLYQEFKQHGHDITPEHWAVLNLLWKEDGLSQTEIADKLSKDKANVTHILNVMERKELVRRMRDENDRRSYRIYLQEQGLALKDKLPQLAQKVNLKGTAGIAKEEIQKITQHLLNICESLE